MYNVFDFRHPEATYHAVVFLTCISTIISSSEYLALRREFSSNGAFGWPVFSSRPVCVAHPALLRHGEFIFGQYATQAIHVLRIAGCLGMLLWSDHLGIARMVLPFLALSGLLLSFRDIIGTDGSDQMTSVIFCALTIYVAFNDSFIRASALVFIACQSVLSYVVAGIAKLISPKWRGGAAMPAIMNTRAYGMEIVSRTHARLPSVVNRVISWGVIFFESSFAAVLFVPRPYFWVFLCWGVIFHLFNAVAMGLNTFLWSFAATYPCIIYTHDLLTA